MELQLTPRALVGCVTDADHADVMLQKRREFSLRLQGLKCKQLGDTCTAREKVQQLLTSDVQSPCCQSHQLAVQCSIGCVLCNATEMLARTRR
jgi:hypothetical protein